ncbi:MAG: hypothetical protein AAGI38_21910 [Bacteroidota bacterium]
MNRISSIKSFLLLGGVLLIFESCTYVKEQASVEGRRELAINQAYLEEIQAVQESEEELNRITRYDTIWRTPEEIGEIRAWDEDGVMVERRWHPINANREIFDKNENLCLRQLGIVHRYTYRYDDQNRLVEKRGFSPGHAGERTLYKYDGQGKLKEVIRFQLGKVVERRKLSKNS